MTVRPDNAIPELIRRLPVFWPRLSHGDVINRRWYRPVINIAYAHCQVRTFPVCLEDFQWQISWTECGISMWPIRLLDTLFDLTISPCVNNSGVKSPRKYVEGRDGCFDGSLFRYFLPLSIGLASPFSYRLWWKILKLFSYRYLTWGRIFTFEYNSSNA